MAKNLNIENIKNIEKILLPLINAFQNDEKEKLNHLGNISKSLIEVREKVKAEMEKLPPQFNVLNSIRRKTSEGRLLTYEPYNSDLLCQLLKIKKEKINFTKLFLEFMNNKFESKIDLNNINWEKVEVENEYKHIDILIRYKKSLAVILENKIGYIDRDRQLEKYYNIMSKEEGCGNNVYAIYLTPEGKEPSENSLPEEYYKKESGELYGKFANIKHAEIGYWLESILKSQEFSFLNNEEENNKYKLLKSALIQIIDNEKSISGKNEESDMTKDEIKNVLKENLFKEIKTVEKAQEYIDMFENAKVLLEEKRAEIDIENRKAIIDKNFPTYVKFTEDVKKYLESKGYEDAYITDYNHDIEHCIHWLGLGEHVFLEADYNDNSLEYHFGVCVKKNDINIKRKIKKLQETIKNIFNFEYNENNDDWIFDYKENIENENPKKIAEVMIKLYELLK